MQPATLTTGDLPQLKELQPDSWPDITPYFEFYLNAPFCQPIKVIDGSSITGIGTTIMHRDSAWLAHIIVHPEFRNRGIGGLITKSLTEMVDISTHSTISLIATPMGEPVYKKAGFLRETDYLFFKNEKYTFAPEENSSIANATPDLYPEILRLDKKASGEDRSVLLEPHLPKIRIFRSSNSISGFYAPTLGEGLVVAENDTAGIALLKLKLQALPFSVVPSENEAAIQFLPDNGFQQFLRGTRMRIGKKLDFKPAMLYGRIGGNLG